MTTSTLISQQITPLLRELEEKLQQLGLWDNVPPSDAQLSSCEPFSIDTLEPEQWIQWVFIAKLNQMLLENQALPRGFSVLPYFAQVWQASPEFHPILSLLEKIDKVCA
ncbi:pseudouridine synthase [Vibrio sp. 10N.286.49.B3]|uniref:YqcC family protein n=1 Tax=Vibrio sp. 10N.286.49.B3 TaxID=1880855 RepID=UPI000C844099|nr:YqcC family protein [Vibrio sp. 10N.286.49.B3]PMH41108.1 pseudouridine synthase [Vibrio sp. 10N.286.49.B3]